MKENKFWKTRRLNAPERSEGVYKFKCFGGPRRGGRGGLLPEKLFWGVRLLPKILTLFMSKMAKIDTPFIT